MSDTEYARFLGLKFDRPAPHVLRVTINKPEKMNALDESMHIELEQIWGVIDNDPSVRCSIITGAGRAFCAGADVNAKQEPKKRDPLQQFSRDFRNASALVQALINSRKPIVSAINGAAIGAGLVIALLADVPIAAKTAKLFDGHTRIGVAAGDHSALIWPLLCGIAKAKYFLMTNEPMTGEQAERNNLVALAVELDELENKSIEVAVKLASSAPTAIRMTKYVLNHWLRQNQSIFDLSLALELVGFTGAEADEAIAAQIEKRPANYDEDSEF